MDHLQYVWKTPQSKSEIFRINLFQPSDENRVKKDDPTVYTYDVA